MNNLAKPLHWSNFRRQRGAAPIEILFHLKEGEHYERGWEMGVSGDEGGSSRPSDLVMEQMLI
jgi:hypothetical protein